jgi:hypothetical protein
MKALSATVLAALLGVMALSAYAAPLLQSTALSTPVQAPLPADDDTDKDKDKDKKGD